MSLEKTYFTDMDCASPDITVTSDKGMFWLFKAMMKGEVTGVNGPDGAASGTAFWSCAGSSDGVTAGMDATDRLLASYDVSKILNSAAGVMSWIVLENVDGYQILMGLKQASVGTMDIAFSKAGFSGGSTTAYPTATDTVLHSNKAFHDHAAVAFNGHITRDANGYFHMCWGKVSTGRIWGRIDFPLLVDTDASDVSPVALMFEYSASTSVGTVASGLIGARDVSNSASLVGSGFAETMFMTGSSTDPNSGATAALLASGRAATFPFFIWLPGASPRQIKGRIPDVLQSFKQFPVGATEPVTGDQERLQFLQLVFPYTAPATL